MEDPERVGIDGDRELVEGHRSLLTWVAAVPKQSPFLRQRNIQSELREK
jgi:hypothetical protein